MTVFAISDLHLAMGVDKPMDIFGNRWEDHVDRLAKSWREQVDTGDTIVIPGDISWAMTLDQAIDDFAFLESLPGTKIILKGNHDYWWSSVTKIENYFEHHGFHTIRLLKNNSFRIDGNTLLCGTRGWILPFENTFRQSDDLIYKRELGRLKASLESAKAIQTPMDRIVAALHYPPLLPTCLETEFTKLMESYGVSRCLFGHIHGNGKERSFEGEQNGVLYQNISADKLAFKPLRL